MIFRRIGDDMTRNKAAAARNCASVFISINGLDNTPNFLSFGAHQEYLKTEAQSTPAANCLRSECTHGDVALQERVLTDP